MRFSTKISLLAVVAALALAACNSQNTSQNGAATVSDSVKDVQQAAPVAAAPVSQAATPQPVNLNGVQGLKIGWVNMDSVLHAYDYYFDMERELTALGTKADKELTAKGQALQAKAQDFQDKMQKGLMTRSEAQQEQEKLLNEQAQFQQLQQQKRQSLADEEQVRLRKVQNAINEFIKKFNQSYGFDYILSGGVLYGNPQYSVTRQVIQGLNREYAATKNAQQKTK